MKRKRALLIKTKPIALPVFFTLIAGMAAAYARSSASAFYPIVDPQTGYLLGGSQNGKWLADKQIAAKMKGGEKYRVWGLNSLLGKTTGTTPQTIGAPCPDTYHVNLRRNYNGQIAFGANWNPTPRRIKVQNVHQKVYRHAVAIILRANHIKHPVIKIKRLWRVDLDGDGTEEVLIAATNYQHSGSKSPRANSAAGEYSLIALRQIVKGKVKTTLLMAEFHPRARTFNAPNEFRLAGVYDLNGDGKLEIIIRSRYYEGGSIHIFEDKNGEAEEALSTGCGA